MAVTGESEASAGYSEGVPSRSAAGAAQPRWGEDGDWGIPNTAGEALHEVNFSFLEGASDPSDNLDAWAHGQRMERWMTGLTQTSVYQSMSMAAAFVWLRLVFFLLLLGLIPASFVFLVDLMQHAVFDAREQLSNRTRMGFALGYLIYVVTGVLLCLLSTLYCYLWSTHAEGSGIPQMKSIMSGFYDKGKASLSLWALAAKALGLVCAIGGGLPVGWEGPFVHISCILAHHLSRLPPFRPLRKDRALRLQIMVCACSVGLASSFGTPMGGVLYALETTAAFYLIPTFWKSILCTISGAVFYQWYARTPLVEAFDNTAFSESDYTEPQLVAFAVLGVLMGACGAFFVKCVHWVYTIRKTNMPGTNRFVLVGLVALVAGLLQYPSDLLSLDPRSTINEFFSADNMISLSWIDVLLLIMIKFPLIVVSIGLPIPAGVFIPSILLGSAFGRLYGELLKMVFGTVIVPGGYAVVGAAAFTTGVTRALSTAVIIFEVTGQLHHMVPTLVAVSLAAVVANSFNRSLYDTLIIMKELPYMPHMRRDRTPSMRVNEIMDKEVMAVKEVSSVDLVEDMLDRFPGFEAFPVVTLNGGTLLGSVRRTTLSSLLDRLEQASVNESTNLGLTPNRTNDEIGRDQVRVTADLGPLIVSDNTALGQLHFMFVMLMPTHAFVVSRGKLVGVVTRSDLVEAGAGHEA